MGLGFVGVGFEGLGFWVSPDDFCAWGSLEISDDRGADFCFDGDFLPVVLVESFVEWVFVGREDDSALCVEDGV